MTVEQLRAFLESSRKLGHTDRQVADFLKGVSLTQRVDESALEDLGASAPGRRSIDALKAISAASKSMPAPPAPPPKPVVVPIPPPSAEEQKQALETGRAYALDYSKNLPNFICTQVTRRYVDPSGLEFWQQQDTLVAKLSFFEQKEDYKVLLANNRFMDTTLDRVGGVVSRGEFGTMLKDIFGPASQGEFNWARWATLRGRRMHVFSYRVLRENSDFTVGYQDKLFAKSGYRGLAYIDRETFAVMRITRELTDLPMSFPVNAVSIVLDYDYAKIGGTEYILPLKATVRSRMGKELQKNDIEFRMYNRFGAETTITFAPDPLPDEATKEEQVQQPK